MIEIDRNIYWEHLGIAGGLAISLFVLLGLILRLREAPSPRMHLWAMVAFFGGNALDMLDSLAYSSVAQGPLALYQWQDVLIPGFMVSVYFFVRGLTDAQPRLIRRDWLHVIPFVLAFGCIAPLLLLPGEIRQNVSGSDLSETAIQRIEQGETLFWALWVLILIVYGGLSIRRLVLHKQNIREIFSDLEGKSLTWLDGIVATVLLLGLFVIFDEVWILTGHDEIRAGWVSVLFDFVLPASFGVFALRAVPPFPAWTEEILEPAQPEPVAPRYARSGLSSEDLNRYGKRLEKRMSEGQLWRDHSLNLRALAAEIAVPPIHLSEVLNTSLGMTFYDYVNQCRIRDACELLIQTDDTILEISETVGFNAKSTFNTSFKKVTDQTPSQWRARHRP